MQPKVNLFVPEVYKLQNFIYFQVFVFQVVWKGTTKMGAGIASNGRGSNYVVARYLPPGNVVGGSQFADNVRPLVCW